MRTFIRRALTSAAILSASLVVQAQAKIWEHNVEYTSQPKMTRDASGNLYLVTRHALLNARQLRVTKINPLGTVVWNTVIAHGVGNQDLQYNIRRVIFAHDAVYVLYHERAGGGSGTFNGTYGKRVEASNGVNTQFFSSASVEIEGLAAYPDRLALSGTFAGSARLFRTGLMGGNQGNLTIPGFNRGDDLACMPDGTAFIAANRPDGTVSIIKVNPNDSFTEYDFNNASRTDEKMHRIKLDSNANRVYAMGSGLFNGLSTDQDVIMYAVNMDGTQPNMIGMGGSNREYPGDFSVLTGGGVGLAYYSEAPAPGSTSVRRLNSALSQLWNQTIANAGTGSERGLAFDADGNFLVLDNMVTQDDAFLRITKKSLGTGATLNTLQLMQTSPTPLELVSDAAGNYFATMQEGVVASLLRLQPANMTFAANTIPGGGLVNATITAVTTASADQTWTLASSNPAAASVPANAVIPNGGASVSFDITTSAVTANTNVSISARYQGFIMQKTLTLVTPTVSALSISPNVVIGGVNTAGLVTISGGAPAGGKTVTLSSNNTAAATVPASVLVPAGSTSFGFGITTFGVTANKGVVITASTGAISRTAFFAVNAPSLLGVSMNPSTVKGGLQTMMSVTLDGIAPVGGRSVVIFSGAPGILFAPASVTVPAGLTVVNQNLSTAAVISTTTVLVFATRSGIYKTATLTVTP